MSKEEKPLQIPAVITKISSHPAGGHNINFHIPETEALQVRPLVGTENRQQYILFLVKGDRAEVPTPKKGKVKDAAEDGLNMGEVEEWAQ